MLTRYKVAVVHDRVRELTGCDWIIFEGDIGHGSRYTLVYGHAGQTYYKGSGAAWVLSYLAGVTRVYGGDVYGGDAKDIMNHLHRTQRFADDADQTGRRHAVSVKARGWTWDNVKVEWS
jgi:hypothetical protein